MDIKMKFLRRSIIEALEETCFCFFSFLLFLPSSKSLNAELQYKQFHLGRTRERVCYDSGGKQMKSTVSFRTNTKPSDEWNDRHRSKSSGNVIYQ